MKRATRHRSPAEGTSSTRGYPAGHLRPSSGFGLERREQAWPGRPKETAQSEAGARPSMPGSAAARCRPGSARSGRGRCRFGANWAARPGAEELRFGPRPGLGAEGELARGRGLPGRGAEEVRPKERWARAARELLRWPGGGPSAGLASAQPKQGGCRWSWASVQRGSCFGDEEIGRLVRSSATERGLPRLEYSGSAQSEVHLPANFLHT